MSDALDDLYHASLAPEPVAPPPGSGLPAPVRAALANARRLAGLGDPALVGGLGLDAGFLLAAAELAPDLFGDLVAWRLGSAATEHATAKPAVVTEASSRGVRHLSYVEGVRRPPARETAAQRRDREAAETAKMLGIYRGRQAV